MILSRIGNLLEADVDAVVNTVNCVGIMGRGIALQFKNTFPGNFQAYAAACDRKEVQPGKMFVYETGKFSPRYIINFPTKRHWKGKSRIEDIDAGLIDLVRVIKDRKILSIAIPPLGSGLGASTGVMFVRGSLRRLKRCPMSPRSYMNHRARQTLRR
ncbi:macro domain-containing protein [Bradyrhizobium sp. SK17]|uniref:macro domain-containing protein n=1 Tax=Bradyrhizobium sp. SK17 TaxID=2057741 RepID=UPI001FE1A8B7|nr:macro domain-containing protein [Bradyrhizobium sp. SK17]